MTTYEVGPDTTLSFPDAGITVQVWRSSGSDGAWVVQIDTPNMPDPVGKHLRVNVNDAKVFGHPYKEPTT